MFAFLKRKRKVEVEEAGDRIVASVSSDTGCHREINEDAVVLVQPTDATTLAEKGVLIVVADGMGGHDAGEVASHMAVEEIERTYYASPDHPAKALEDSFQRANRAILDRAASEKAMAGMGTTCTALVLRGPQAYSRHIGDSRLYLVRGGDIYQMTEDDSEVMHMVRAGVITLEEARRHEDRNVLLRVLGTHAEPAVSAWPEPLPVHAGDRFVLCSDGLHDSVQPDEIRDAVLNQDPDTACHTLVDLARQRGGYDNITVAVAALGPVSFRRNLSLRETRVVEVTR